MKILMTGCSESVGAYLRERLMPVHQVYGVGLGGPDKPLDFRMPYSRMEAEAEDAVLEAFAKLDGLDCIINNAGMTYSKFMPDHGMTDFDRVMKVNVGMPLALTQAAIQFQQKAEWRHLSLQESHFRVINMGSMCIKLALRGAVAYTASKAAIHAFTRVLAKEAAGKYPLIALTISPAAIEKTNMIDYATNHLIADRGMTEEEARAYSHQSSPLGRAVTHEEVWNVLKFALQAPEYMSGCNLEMPGGSGNF